MTAIPLAARRSLAASALLILLMGGAPAGQTDITRPADNFTPAEDIELGREAAAAIRRQQPILSDERLDAYVSAVGRRLIESVPEPFRQPGFEYGFTVLNLRTLTSAALPGGQIFVGRRMLELAPSDDAFAGLLAHELAHVLLRHATAQVSVGEPYQVGPITGHMIATALKNNSTNILERAASFTTGTYFLMSGMEYEREADRLAVRVMARAGYKPLELGVMFETIRNEGGMLWSMRHPSPDDGEEGSRFDVITGEAARVRIGPAPVLDEALASIQSWLADVPAPAAAPPVPGQPPHIGTLGYGVVVPSGEYQDVMAGDVLELSVPTNWRRLPAGNTVTFSPDGAFLRVLEGPIAYTHGLQLGIARSLTGYLATDVQALLAAFGQGSSRLTWAPFYAPVKIAGRAGLATTLNNVSSATGDFEVVMVSAAHLPDGSFLYVVGIAPQDVAGVYRQAFTRVVESIRIRN